MHKICQVSWLWSCFMRSCNRPNIIGWSMATINITRFVNNWSPTTAALVAPQRGGFHFPWRPRPALLGLVDAGLVVLVLGVEARLEVVEQRSGRRHQLAHHGAARQQHAGGRGRPAPLRRRRGGGAALAPLCDLALDVQRAALGAAAARAGHIV